MSNLALSRRIWLWVSFSKMLSSLFFIVVSISWNNFFNFALLWEAKFSRAPLTDATRWWGSEFQMKFGSSRRFEEIVVFVSLKDSSWTQIDSKSNIVMFLKSFCWLVYLIPKFLGFDIHSPDWHFLLVHCEWLNIAPSWMLCWKKCHNWGCEKIGRLH